ncbi:MAG: DUF503 domain-containing protein [Chloroflexi bacterium]|nr:MAG: DUF503 domain-containing protein [Chloroflexota bacterium]
MIVGICTIELHLPGIASLKQKRSVIKPLLSRIHKTFNVSSAEIDAHDVWQSAVIGIAVVSNSTVHARRVLNNILRWIEQNYPDVYISGENIEIL